MSHESIPEARLAGIAAGIPRYKVGILEGLLERALEILARKMKDLESL